MTSATFLFAGVCWYPELLRNYGHTIHLFSGATEVILKALTKDDSNICSCFYTFWSRIQEGNIQPQASRSKHSDSVLPSLRTGFAHSGCVSNLYLIRLIICHLNLSVSETMSFLCKDSSWLTLSSPLPTLSWQPQVVFLLIIQVSLTLASRIWSKESQ